MKSLFVVVFIISTCAQVKNNKAHEFSVNIWDYNYSMAYTTFYKINSDSIVVTNISGVVNEENKILLSKETNASEQEKIYNFLSSFPLESLANEYTDPLVEDGDRKKVEIIFANKKKTIDLENFYQKDIDQLFTVVNQVLDKSMQIKYSK